ncbi:MAG: phosphoribosyl 1,2-cyclic phosphodiesterase [Planctomycetota bacterium]|jgi:phosphoribosyl 1,2-cyclic phosphodiesterase
MQIQVLGSGSKGNSTLVTAGELRMLVDAGLSLRELRARLELARVPFKGLEHIVVTHAHLDHARSAGALAKSHSATVHCAEAMMSNRSVSRAPRKATHRIGADQIIDGGHGDSVQLSTFAVPHDCPPTVAVRLDHEGRRFVLLTDMGHPVDQVARQLSGAHLLMLEFNHCAEMLETGPYPASLKRRVLGNQGHLSNDQAAVMLRGMAGPELHTLVLAHLSETNNTPERALECATSTLESMGLGHVKVMIAPQHEIMDPILV